MPDAFDGLVHDMSVASTPESAWRRPGESIRAARDRLREGRERARRALAAHEAGRPGERGGNIAGD